MGYKYVETLTQKGYKKKEISQNKLRFRGINTSSLYKSIKILLDKYHSHFKLSQFKALMKDLMNKNEGRLRLNYPKNKQLLMIFADKQFYQNIGSNKKSRNRRMLILDYIMQEFQQEREQAEILNRGEGWVLNTGRANRDLQGQSSQQSEWQQQLQNVMQQRRRNLPINQQQTNTINRLVVTNDDMFDDEAQQLSQSRVDSQQLFDFFQHEQHQLQLQQQQQQQQAIIGNNNVNNSHNQQHQVIDNQQQLLMQFVNNSDNFQIRTDSFRNRLQ